MRVGIVHARKKKEKDLLRHAYPHRPLAMARSRCFCSLGTCQAGTAACATRNQEDAKAGKRGVALHNDEVAEARL